MRFPMTGRRMIAAAGRSVLGATAALLQIVGITALLFGALNYAAYLDEPAAPAPVDDTFSASLWPGSPASLPVLRAIFGVSTDGEAMARFNASPGFAFHPTLPFATARVDNRFYRIGLEGARYQPGWTDAYVESLLRGDRPMGFMLGGSTLLGHGLAGNETMPYYLNEIVAPSGLTFVNFGAQAYDQRAEIDKLIYLLKRGYRPRVVIFLDGWNDLFLARSNMRLEDDVIFHGFSLNRAEIAFTPGAMLPSVDRLKLFAESLPLYRWLEARERPKRDVAGIPFDRDAFTAGFDFREADYVFRHWAAYGELHRAAFEDKIVRYYRSNLMLLRTLAQGYGFRLLVFFQPMTFLEPGNPFVTPAARRAPGYRYIEDMVKTVRAHIASGDLPMIDLSDALDGVRGYRSIDIAHYAPASNRALAEAVARELAAPQP